MGAMRGARTTPQLQALGRTKEGDSLPRGPGDCQGSGLIGLEPAYWWTIHGSRRSEVKRVPFFLKQLPCVFKLVVR